MKREEMTYWDQSTAKIGIIMLDTTFPRIPGDIGNADTFLFPVKYKVVAGATVRRVVKKHDPALLQPFIEAARELENEGVQAITTSCGFLSLFQKEIAAELTVPFYSSSLLQIPFVYTLTGKSGPLGIITANKSSLSEKHLLAADVHDIPLIIAGMEEMPAFRQCVLEGGDQLDKQEIEREIVYQAAKMIREHPTMRALVLECTNMPPYRESLKRATGLPVFDIVTLTNYMYESLP